MTITLSYIETPLGKVPTFDSLKKVVYLIDEINKKINEERKRTREIIGKVKKLEEKIINILDDIKTLKNEAKKVTKTEEKTDGGLQEEKVNISLDNIIGYEDVLEKIEKIKDGDAVLITGDQGVGKSTFGALIAKIKRKKLYKVHPFQLIDHFKELNKLQENEENMILIDDAEYGFDGIMASVILALLMNRERRGLLVVVSNRKPELKMLRYFDKIINIRRPTIREVEMFVRSFLNEEPAPYYGLTFGEILAIKSGKITLEDLLPKHIDIELVTDDDLYERITKILEKLIKEPEKLEIEERVLLSRYPYLTKRPYLYLLKLSNERKKIERFKEKLIGLRGEGID